MSGELLAGIGAAGRRELEVEAIGQLAARAATVHTVAEARAFARELERAQAGELPPPMPPAAPPSNLAAAGAPASGGGWRRAGRFEPAGAEAEPQPTQATTGGLAAPAALGTATAGLNQQRIEEVGAAPYASPIVEAANRYGIEPALLFGLVQQESGFNPNAQSPAGAVGLTQLMPGTAAALGVSNPLDPREALEGGARYLAQLLREFNGNVELALAAYNAGPGAVRAAGGIPPIPETQTYVADVLANAAAFRG